MKTIRLTLAQAIVGHLAALRIELEDGRLVPYCGGVFAIFGHGNVAGLGQALQASRAVLPTYRAHNEQGMAHAAIAYAKANFRRRMMAVTTSIGPGATNLVTAAALAHVNRLPVLLLPGDAFASRAPDPVLQQLEDFQHGDLSVNDSLRPVTRFFDRIVRPEQVLAALPQAIRTMVDPASCGPVCLALPQDVQAETFDCPEEFLAPAPLHLRRSPPDPGELGRALAALRGSRRPLLIAGGGVLYSEAGAALAAFATGHGVPVCETQAGKGSLAWNHPLNLGAIGVTGSPAANDSARDADLVIAVGTRLQDFTTGSHALFPQATLLSVNVQAFDAHKWHGLPLVCDARVGLAALSAGAHDWHVDADWTGRARSAAQGWNERVTDLTTRPLLDVLPYDADVIGAVRDSTADSPANDLVVCAAGTLPAELHKLWRSGVPGNYHVEYGYSCMGYEIAGALGAKLARPQREVIAMVGDGSYLMMNSEIATSVMLGVKLIVLVLDNRGYGCIQRLQEACGGASFNNLLGDCVAEGGVDVRIDFAAHARALGADSEHVPDIAALRLAMVRARSAAKTQVLVIDTTHRRTTDDGGCWWEVGIPEVSERVQVDAAAAQARESRHLQRP
jgi:3D-(3,5/4)-trihydroxycyclohexane-1,2-dione acylhydrolase (decyclizing)